METINNYKTIDINKIISGGILYVSTPLNNEVIVECLQNHLNYVILDNSHRFLVIDLEDNILFTDNEIADSGCELHISNDDFIELCEVLLCM